MAAAVPSCRGEGEEEERRKRAREREDRLPDEVLVHILSFLPTTKQRVATSSVSRRWRRLWSFVPSLHFDSRVDNPRDPTRYLQDLDNFVHVYHTRAPEGQRLLRFHAHISGHLDPGRFRRTVSGWIRTAGSRSVRELSLSLDEGNGGDTWTSLPRRVLPCLRTLRVLHLQGYSVGKFPFEPSPQTGLFPCLETLVLRRVAITDNNLGALLANCPGLEGLEIFDCRCLRKIDVSSPRLRILAVEIGSCEWHPVSLEVHLPELRQFRFAGFLQGVRWKVLPKPLWEAQLELIGPWDPFVCSRFHEAFTDVEFLSASSAFFQSRSIRIFKKKLRVLHCAGLECHKNFLPFLNYLSECLCLEELYITLYHEGHNHQHGDGDCEVDLKSDALYKWSWNFATKKITILGFTNTMPAIVLAKYLLSRTQLLEKLTLAYDTECSLCVDEIRRETSKEIRKCYKASPNVRILIRSSQGCPSLPFSRHKF